MPDVVKHAWTHRRRSRGGTDPLLDFGLVWATAEKGAASVSYSGGFYTPRWQSLATNDVATFTGSGPSGGLFDWVQINEPGYYHVWSMITNFGAPWGTEATSIETGYDAGAGAFTLLSVGASLADFSLEFSRADQKLDSSDDPNSTLFQFNSFHWQAGNGDDLGAVNPLKLSTRINSDGDQGAVDLYVLMHIVQIGSPGYTLIDADDL